MHIIITQTEAKKAFAVGMWPSALEGFPETQCFQQPLHGWEGGCPSHRDQHFIIAVLISWDSAQGRDALEWSALIDLTSTAQSLVSVLFLFMGRQNLAGRSRWTNNLSSWDTHLSQQHKKRKHTFLWWHLCNTPIFTKLLWCCVSIRVWRKGTAVRKGSWEKNKDWGRAEHSS